MPRMLPGVRGIVSRIRGLLRLKDEVVRVDLAKAMELGVLNLVQRVSIGERVDENGEITQRVEVKLYDAQVALQLLG